MHIITDALPILPPDIVHQAVYAALAEGIDAHGPEHSEMFLAKAALLLAEALGDEDRALRAIADAQRNMTGMRRPD